MGRPLQLMSRDIPKVPLDNNVGICLWDMFPPCALCLCTRDTPVYPGPQPVAMENMHERDHCHGSKETLIRPESASGGTPAYWINRELQTASAKRERNIWI